MSRTVGRRLGVLVVATALGVSLSACAAVPPFPTLPELDPSEVAALDLVPTDLPALVRTLDPTDTAGLSPDGFDAVHRMAVRIRNIGCGRISTGSGFAIDSHTLITNRHVVADSQKIQVSTHDGRDVEVETASSAALADLAVVRTRDPLPWAPELGDADPVAGDPITVAGYPEGGALTVTEGTVLGPANDPLNENLGQVLVTDAPVEPGSSGSAALDASGRVVGVVYARTDDGRSLLVPVSTLRKLLEDASAFEPVVPCA